MRRIGKLCDVAPGKTPSKAAYTSSGDIKMVKFRDVLETGEVDYYNDEEGWFDSRYADDSDLVDLLPDTILLTNAAHSTEYIGKKVAYVESTPDIDSRVCYVGELTGIRSKTEALSTKWLFYWLQTSDARKAIVRAVEGAHLVPREFKRIDIPEFSESEQNFHLTALDAVDDAIAKAKAELEATRELKRSLIDRLLTIGKNSSNQIVETKFGPVPTHWEIKSLVEHAGTPNCVKTGPFGAQLPPESFDKSGMQFVNITDIGEGVLDFSEIVYIKDFEAERLADYQLKSGDLVFSRVASVGRVALIPESMGPFMMSSNCIRLRASDSFDPNFLCLLFLSSPFIKRQVTAMSTGGSRSIVTPRFLRRLLIARSPVEEQQEISEIVGMASANETKKVEVIEALQQVKNSLLQNLLTGKIRIPEVAIHE